MLVKLIVYVTPVSKTTSLETSTETLELDIVPVVAVTPLIVPVATRVSAELV